MVKITQEGLNKYFRYDKNTGILYSRILNKFKYQSKYINGAFHYMDQVLIVHRTIWIMTYGDIPEGLRISHIDGNKKNNLLSNLKISSHSIACRHRKGLNKNNTSGRLGVSFFCKAYYARIRIKRKMIYLGRSTDFLEACKLRRDAEIKYGCKVHPLC